MRMMLGVFQISKSSLLKQLEVCVLLLVLLCRATAQDEEFEDDLPGHNERRLLRNLIDNYPHRDMVLPSDNYQANEPLTVSIGIILQQIINVSANTRKRDNHVTVHSRVIRVVNECFKVKRILSREVEQASIADEKNQVITLNVWLDLSWNDLSLTWDPEEYGGLTEIHLNPKKVWKPDVLLYTSADERFDATYHTNIIVQHNGYANWLPPGLVRSTCKIDVTYFPFDTQMCFLKYGVWTYHGYLVDLVLSENPSDTSAFMTNGEWILQGLKANRSVKIYACCPEPYPDVKFYVAIKRRSMYYTVNILIPCVLLSVLSLLSFILPAETGEKLSFCITVLLALNVFMGLLGGKLPTTSTSIPLIGVTILLSVIVFMLVLADILPSTSLSYPLLGKYFTCVLIMVSISVIMTITTINLNSRTPNTHKMHRWVRKVLLEWLPIILWMKQPGRVYKPLCGGAERDKIAGQSQRGIELLESAPSYRDRRGNGAATQSNYFNDVNLIGIKYANYATDENEPMIGDSRSAPKERRNRELCLILEELRVMNGRYERQERDDQEVYDWKFASMVVDRLSLAIISLLTAIVTFKILSSAPVEADENAPL